MFPLCFPISPDKYSMKPKIFKKKNLMLYVLYYFFKDNDVSFAL